MTGITSFFDRAANFLMDPCNPKFSHKEQRFARVVTILIGISTLGIAHIVSVLWRKLRHIEEPNKTHKIINQQFRKIFGAKDINIGNVQLPPAALIHPVVKKANVEPAVTTPVVEKRICLRLFI